MSALPTGIAGPLVVPGSNEWLATMSASKIAAVVGLSPYESRFALWHRMAGNLDPTEDTDEMRRGHYLEPAIATWFADQHPEWTVAPTGTWSHPDRPWQTASPDRLITKGDGQVAVLECKTDIHTHNWGQPGSDDIPVYYRAQTLWQLDTLGVDQAHVAVLTGALRFQEYVVDYDATEAADLRAAAVAFLDDLADGVPPEIDGSAQTYQIIQEMHPKIDGTDVTIDDELARRFCTARVVLADAQTEEQAARSTLAMTMGTARRARWGDFTIATRQVRGDSDPFVVAGRKLPQFTTTREDPTP